MDKFKKLLLKEGIKSILGILVGLSILTGLVFFLIYWFNHDDLTLMGVVKEFWWITISLIILSIYGSFEDKIWRK